MLRLFIEFLKWFISITSKTEVDVLLVTLLRISRDKAYDRFIKTETGKKTHRVCEVNRRHKAAEVMLENNKNKVITVKSNEEWTISSQMLPDVHYTIKRNNSSCECKLICFSCGVCIHNFTCTCLDSTHHSTVCKHIHYLIISTVGNTVRSKHQAEEFSGKYLFCSLPSDKKVTELEELKRNANALTSEIQLLIQECDNVQVMTTLKEHLKTAISVTKVLMTTKTDELSLSKRRQYTPNINHKKQIVFHSTRRKRRCNTDTTLLKPSSSELLQARKKI